MIIVRINPGERTQIVTLNTETKEIMVIQKTESQLRAEMWLPNLDKTKLFVVLNNLGDGFTIWEDYLTAAGIPFVLLTDLEKL